MAFPTSSSSSNSDLLGIDQVNADLCDPFRTHTIKEGVAWYYHASDSFVDLRRTFEALPWVNGAELLLWCGDECEVKRFLSHV